MLQLEQAIQTFDSATLAPLACLASGRANLRLDGWQTQTLSGGVEAGTSIQRISGTGLADGESVPWSLVVKTINRGPANGADPQASHFATREANYYSSGILSDLPGGLRAPRCYGVLEQPNHVHIFLETVQDAFKGNGATHIWPVEYFHTAARTLGRFNGAYLVKRPVPAAEWIPRRWLRAYVEESAASMDLLFQNAEHPMVRRTLGGFTPEWLRQMWDTRSEVMDALDRLPQVFSHQDAFCRNLFAETGASGGVDPEGRLVAIDWSYSGPAPLGAELVALVAGSIGLGCVSPSEIDRLYTLTLEGYLEGLSEAGWHGSPDLVRIGCGLTLFWRYPIGAMIGESMPLFIDESLGPVVEQLFGMTVEQYADLAAGSKHLCLPYYDEALHLLKELNL